jgi:3D (Asp-Asp-Asp) domain-containing protein
MDIMTRPHAVAYRAHRIALAGAVLACLAGWSIGVTRPAGAVTIPVRTTYYLPTGNAMRDGVYPYWGAAACDWRYLPYGTVFRVAGLEFTCRDTGGLVRGYHVDLYVPSWDTARWLHELVGDWSTIEVISWGQNPAWWRG